MNYMKIVEADTKSGIGYRVTIFVSGCSVHPHCDKCFNKEAWSFHSGKPFTEDTKKEILYYLSKPYISGFSILGGDCISNVKKDDTLLDLVKTIKNIYPNKTIYAWTGFSYEQIINDEKCCKFLQYIDMLRDGRYIDSLRNINQYLEGSTNQRYIDVQSSLKQGKVIEFEEFKKR